MNEFYEALQPLVERATGNVRNRYPSYISREDIEQSIWEAAIANQDTIELALKEEGGEKLVMHILLREGRRFALNEDAAINGYDPEDIYMYSEEVIKELLEHVFEYQDWQSFATFGDGMPRARKDPSHSGDYVAMMVDVKAAVEKLPEDQYNAILWYYKYHYTHAMLGDTLGISEDAARKRVKRSVGAVQRNLGRRELSDLRRGYSSRLEPATTAEARAWTERDYEG